MYLPTATMTIVPSASLVPGQHYTQSIFSSVTRTVEDAAPRLEIAGAPELNEPIHASIATWLLQEDEYFPFDADCFEER